MFEKNRKQLDDSIYTFVDKILINHGIIRAAYHGGDITGGGILAIMDSAHEILTGIKGHLISCVNENPSCSYTEDDVTNIYNDHELTLWDDALSVVQKLDPSV